VATRPTRAARPLVLLFGTVAAVGVALVIAWILDFGAFLGLLTAVIFALVAMWAIARTGRPGRSRREPGRAK